MRCKPGILIVLIVLFPLLGCSPAERAETTGEVTSEQPEGLVREETGASALGETNSSTARSGFETTQVAEKPRPGKEALLVPVAHLMSPQEGTTIDELSRSEDLAVAQETRGAVAALLDDPDLTPYDSSSAVVEHVSQTPGAIGLVPWEEVDPRAKALSVDGKSLLAPETSGLEGYRLQSVEAKGPDPEKLRRIVVAGDIVLDRGQNYMVIQQGMGLDFPLDGGYAAITGRTAEPSPYSEFGVIHQFTAERRGGTGEVREYLRSADLTLANLENPVIRNAVWHPDATTFTGDLRLLPILQQASIDGVTLGNNHILDAGAPGLQETLGHLKDAGIRSTGAGMNLQAAREPMIFELGETRVGILNHQGCPPTSGPGLRILTPARRP